MPVHKANWFVKPEMAEKALEESERAIDIGKHRAPWNDGSDGQPAGFYWRSAGLLGPWALVQGDLSDPEKRFYNLATAASITGYVRAYLWRHIHRLRQRGAVPLYCDTDSIAYAGDPGDAFAIGKALGEWSEEGPFDRGAIAGKKLYAFRYTTPRRDKAGRLLTHKIASKGVRMDADGIFRVAGGATVTVQSITATFSVHAAPKFQARKVKATADD